MLQAVMPVQPAHLEFRRSIADGRGRCLRLWPLGFLECREPPKQGFYKVYIVTKGYNKGS